MDENAIYQILQTKVANAISGFNNQKNGLLATKEQLDDMIVLDSMIWKYFRGRGDAGNFFLVGLNNEIEELERIRGYRK